MTAVVTALIGVLLGAAAAGIGVAVLVHRLLRRKVDEAHSWRRRACAIAGLAQAHGLSAQTVNALLYDEQDPADPDATRLLSRGDQAWASEVLR